MKKIRVNGRVLDKYSLASLIDRIRYSYAVAMYKYNTYDEFRSVLRILVANYPDRVKHLNIENL